MRSLSLATGCIVLAVGSLTAAAQEQSCTETAMQNTVANRSFLEEQNRNRSSPCIATAIKALGNAQDKMSISILVKYLDYLDPNTGPNSHSRDRKSYPAVTALFQIGQASGPYLVSAIVDHSSELSRHNAAVAYMIVFRDDLAKGIRYLQKVSQTTSDNVAKQRLNTALQMLASDCNGRSSKEAQECRDALDTRSN